MARVPGDQLDRFQQLRRISESLADQRNPIEKTEKNTEKTSSLLEKVAASLTGFKGDDLEAEREGGKPNVVPQDTKGGGKSGDDGFKLLPFLKGLIPAVGTILAGVAGTIIATFTELGNDIARTFAAVFTFKALFPERFAKMGDLLATKVADLQKSLKSGLYKMLMLGEDGKPIAKVTKGIQGAQGAGPVVKFFRMISDVFSRIKGIFSKVPLEKIGKVIPLVGGILKKIFFPIGLLVTAYDTVKGFMEGMEKDGLFGGITGGLGGLLGSLVGAPLDLLKSLVSSVAGFFGFEKVEEFLDSFNIQQLINDFFQAIPGAISDAADWVSEKFSNITENIPEFNFSEIVTKAMNGIAGLFKGAVNSLLEAVADLVEELPFGEEAAAKIRSFKFNTDAPATSGGSTEDDFDFESAAANATSEAENVRRTGSVTGSYGLGERVIMTEEARIKAQQLAEETGAVTRRRSGRYASPVVIQDNSSRVQGGSSSQGVIMTTNPWDTNDPYAAGMGGA